VQTVIARSSSAEPSRWLEEVWGPIIPQLNSVVS
jgi:hypothetical protein